MASIGDIFRAARERKGVTPSQAALATRMKIQHIEALEQNRFDRIPAPAYVRGFIRMYADYLGLEPGGLIARYNDEYGPNRTTGTSRAAEPASPPPAQPGEPAAVAFAREKARTSQGGLVDRLTAWVGRLFAWLPTVPWRIVLPVVLTLGLVIGVVRYVVSRPPPPAEPAVVVEPVTRVKVPPDVPTRIAQEPDFHIRTRPAPARAP